MRPPDFWQTGGTAARLLNPFGKIYGAVTKWRLKHTTPTSVSVPVISVGNLTVGGTGKTPIVRDLTARLRALGHQPAVILRGYGGKLKGPVQVDPYEHGVVEVGDEALIHATDGVTWVSRHRAAGAHAAIGEGATAIVLDDAHQHPTLAKDESLIVVDGAVGFGNHRVIPAGPLREDVRLGLARADGVVILGNDQTDLKRRLPTALPVMSGGLRADPSAAYLKGRKVVAFAGLARPDKFFDTLAQVGARVVAAHPFDDHHLFQTADIQPILDEAFAIDALPVTTEKDAVRLSPDQRQQVDVLKISVVWQDEAEIDALLQRLLNGR